MLPVVQIAIALSMSMLIIDAIIMLFAPSTETVMNAIGRLRYDGVAFAVSVVLWAFC